MNRQYELDKIKGEEFSVLLFLMQSGQVARLKKGMREVDQMAIWIFAGVNLLDRRQPVLSRFVKIDFKPYTREVFLEVAQEVKDRDLARYVAGRLVLCTKDSPPGHLCGQALRQRGVSGPV